MLKLNKLEVGVFPSSQMQGMPVIHFDIIDDGKDYELDAEGKPTQEGLVKCSEAILNDIKTELENNHWEEDWVDFLLAKKYGVSKQTIHNRIHKAILFLSSKVCHALL